MNPIAVKAVSDSIPNPVKIGIGVLALVGIGVAWYQIDKHFFKEARQARRAEKKSNKSPYWDGNYCEENRSNITITKTQASEYAKNIESALFGFNDIEKVIAQVRLCKTGADWSYVCRTYANNYGVDLFTEISNELNNEDKIKLYTAVDKLPKNK